MSPSLACFWNAEEYCFLVSVGKEKRKREKSPHPSLGEKVRDIMGCFEQVVLKSPLAESVIFMLSGHPRGRHIWGS